MHFSKLSLRTFIWHLTPANSNSFCSYNILSLWNPTTRCAAPGSESALPTAPSSSIIIIMNRNYTIKEQWYEKINQFITTEGYAFIFRKDYQSLKLYKTSFSVKSNQTVKAQILNDQKQYVRFFFNRKGVFGREKERVRNTDITTWCIIVKSRAWN